MKNPSDRELWENGCLTRVQLATWSDEDLAKHAAGMRKTMQFLLYCMDSSIYERTEAPNPFIKDQTGDERAADGNSFRYHATGSPAGGDKK